MLDPYLTLGIRESVTDEAVVKAYHAMLRMFPPESYPNEFASISEAYEAIRSEEDRMELRLLGAFPELEQLADLAANEPSKAFNVDKSHWVAVATQQWLSEDGA